MIGRLRGILDSKNPPYLLIDVGGVGYELQASFSTIYKLPELGATVTLLTHFHVREDAQVLYGFYEEQERTLFRALIKVSGVGPKMALGILSGMEVAHFIQCIERRDTAPLICLPGIGKKTAERLVIEMAGKLDWSSKESDTARKLLESAEGSIGRTAFRLAESEAVSALIALGYKPQEATRAIGKILHDAENEGAGWNSQELIRKALKGLAKV